MELRNKPPHWNESLRCWCLNFRGRVKLASVKNFQLIASTDPTKTIVMQASICSWHFHSLPAEEPTQPCIASALPRDWQSKATWGGHACVAHMHERPSLRHSVTGVLCQCACQMTGMCQSNHAEGCVHHGVMCVQPGFSRS